MRKLDFVFCVKLFLVSMSNNQARKRKPATLVQAREALLNERTPKKIALEVQTRIEANEDFEEWDKDGSRWELDELRVGDAFCKLVFRRHISKVNIIVYTYI